MEAVVDTSSKRIILKSLTVYFNLYQFNHDWKNKFSNFIYDNLFMQH